MNITALIKLSHRHPNGAVSRATFEYLSSMAEKEGSFNRRRASVTPSDYWRRRLATYHLAVVGIDPSPYSSFLEKRASNVPRFRGGEDTLMHLALQSHPLRVILADESDELDELIQEVERSDQVDLKKEEKALLDDTYDREVDKKDEGKKKREDKSEEDKTSPEYESKKESAQGLLSKYKKQLTGEDSDGDQKQKTFLALTKTIDTIPELKEERIALANEWTKAQKAYEKVPYTDINGEKKEAEIQLSSMREWSKVKNEDRRKKYKARWDEAYGAYVDEVLDLTLKAILWEYADEEESKEEGSKEEGSKEEESKEEESKEEDEDGDWFDGDVPNEEKPEPKPKKKPEPEPEPEPKPEDKDKKDDEMDIEDAKEIITKAGGDPSDMTPDEMRAAALSILKGGRGRGGKKTTEELDGEVDPQEVTEGFGLSQDIGGNLFQLPSGFEDGDFGYSPFGSDTDFGYRFAKMLRIARKIYDNTYRIKMASVRLRNVRRARRW